MQHFHAQQAAQTHLVERRRVEARHAIADQAHTRAAQLLQAPLHAEQWGQLGRGLGRAAEDVVVLAPQPHQRVGVHVDAAERIRAQLHVERRLGHAPEDDRHREPVGQNGDDRAQGEGAVLQHDHVHTLGMEPLGQGLGVLLSHG